MDFGSSTTGRVGSAGAATATGDGESTSATRSVLPASVAVGRGVGGEAIASFITMSPSAICGADSSSSGIE